MRHGGRDRDRLFHIIARDAWTALGPTGAYRPLSLTAEGFVHLSYADQVLGTANRFYRDAAEPMAVEFSRRSLGSEIVDEDTYSSGQDFPHLYGPLPVAAAVAVHPLRRDPGSDFVWTVTAG